MKENLKFPFLLRATVFLLFIWLLYFMFTEFRNYLYPLTLGILFAYLLYPLARRFENLGIPRILSNILSILIGFIVVYGLVFLLYKQFGLFLEDVPNLKETAASNVNNIFNNIEQWLGIKTGEMKQQVKELINNLLSFNGNNFKSTFGATFNTMFTIFIMPVYIFFLLFYRNKFKVFTLMLLSEKQHKLAEKIIDEINKVTVHYMKGMVSVVAILIILNTSGFLFIGLKHPLLLGLIAALMNFIPYYGTILGYSFPLFFAIFTMDSPSYAVFVIIQFIIVQFTENNILTPNIVGAHVNINPFMIILSITLGGFVWGLPGMFIAVPVVTAFRVLGENVPGLEPLGFLLGPRGAEEHAITRKKIKRIFTKKSKRDN
jgi:predicted PurR-regulated permease PerM